MRCRSSAATPLPSCENGGWRPRGLRPSTLPLLCYQASPRRRSLFHSLSAELNKLKGALKNSLKHLRDSPQDLEILKKNGEFAPALFKPKLRDRHPRPQHCVAALHAVGLEPETNGCKLTSGIDVANYATTSLKKIGGENSMPPVSMDANHSDPGDLSMRIRIDKSLCHCACSLMQALQRGPGWASF